MSNFTLKARITIRHANGRSTTECTTAIGLANEGIHALVQDVGTAKARELILAKLDDYEADYPGFGVPK